MATPDGHGLRSSVWLGERTRPHNRVAAGIQHWAPSQETHGRDGRCDLTQPVHGGFEMRLQLSARLPWRSGRTARTLGPGGGHGGHGVWQVRPDPQGLWLRRGESGTVGVRMVAVGTWVPGVQSTPGRHSGLRTCTRPRLVA